MKHNGNGNGNYFRVWLEQYKARLEQVALEGGFNSSAKADAQHDASAYSATTNEAPAPPAFAGDLSAYFLPSTNLRTALSK